MKKREKLAGRENTVRGNMRGQADCGKRLILRETCGKHSQGLKPAVVFVVFTAPFGCAQGRL
jgi:hypothetical protein